MSEHDLRVGLVGAGRMGADHAVRVHERTSGARLVAVADPDLERAQQVADGTGARAAQDPYDVITASDVDALVIASPGAVHEPLLLAAIERGVPVLCEKPLTPDAQSSLRVLEAEEKRGQRLIQVGFMRRFDAEYVELKRLLGSGELGRALLLHCAHRNPFSPPGFTSQMMVYDSVVHEFDTTRWLLDDEIAAVSVRAPRSSEQSPEGLLDPQLVTIETAGGVLVDVEIFVNCGFGYQVRCEAVAERGTALIGADGGPLVHRNKQWGGAVTADFRDRFGAAFDREFQRWADAARRGEVDGEGASAWDGYAAAVACEAGVRAQATGDRTEVELVDRPDFYAKS
ncbi:Gfo/Idh/MocA family protein [Saccharopolyspora rectivirgula]|jgi:myo-inositol 2-dehydrogenase/D-chiro-inositol 1-dehydrogenase|uniref:Inositol 2-dehydrogenase n=1 Tax=Saccharopolyspora rectivirgula TaxID=28042 RepID=A0A073AW62_9PSEU|nr:Gfo/Idh/MocA family oxidoreductase [Saccharopolyspora rectivirgula]KEI43581.1 inositol 2-dehydrogenase [Saccharopolyspora rectivirgula]